MARYKYDGLNRLIREDNKPMDKTTLFSYDTAGNITERCEYAFTSKEGEALEELACTHYSYDYEGDRLVSYNGESVAYNVLGNPTTYRGNAVEWQYGNRLTKFGTTTFAYDGAGRRVSKGNITFTYDSAGNLIKQSNGLEFIYDNSGVIGLKYAGNTYFYRRDAQGNIIALIDNAGEVVVEYKYDAWGNHEATVADETYVALAEINPFRYRGYYFDEETGLYFLQTRYYDPEVGRFISRDSIEYADPETICGLNLYAYCGNNPVMNVDPSGHAFLVFLFAALIGFAVSFVSSAVSQAVFNDGQINWGIAAIDGLFGAISGALWMVPGLGPVATGLINFGLTAFNGVITTGIENGWKFSLADGLTIAASSIMSGIFSGVTRSQFFNAGGRKVLQNTHQLVKTVTRRIVTGYYNNSMDIFSSSYRSAFSQMMKKLFELNFGDGYYKDWIATMLQSVFSTSFANALRGIMNGKK